MDNSLDNTNFSADFEEVIVLLAYVSTFSVDQEQIHV